MTHDLLGRPIGKPPEFKLNLQQKRQATLLYYWMSVDYLRDLKAMIDALIKGADVHLALAKRQGRDALMTNERWGVRDTATNWSTNVFPALEDFRKSTNWHIAQVANEVYGKTGATQCARMISEFSSLWMTEEEEQQFKQQFESVYHHAQFIDFASGVGGRRNQLSPSSFTTYWAEHAPLFAKLPKFNVRTDIQGLTDQRPPRTGVYVAQDDVDAALQFAWIGDEDGMLGVAETLNETGRRLTAAVGRDAMWIDGQKMAIVASEAFRRGEISDRGTYDVGDEADPRWVRGILMHVARTTQPCKWYFVERVEGEFDDEDSPAPDATPQAQVLRCEAKQPCPRTGYWFTPAQADSRQHFAQGQVMPVVGGDYGSTIWQWDERQ
jgi:hypothetical protein